jgi:hypothetical protein
VRSLVSIQWAHARALRAPKAGFLPLAPFCSAPRQSPVCSSKAHRSWCVVRKERVCVGALLRQMQPVPSCRSEPPLPSARGPEREEASEQRTGREMIICTFHNAHKPRGARAQRAARAARPVASVLTSASASQPAASVRAVSTTTRGGLTWCLVVRRSSGCFGAWSGEARRSLARRRRTRARSAAAAETCHAGTPGGTERFSGTISTKVIPARPYTHSEGARQPKESCSHQPAVANASQLYGWSKRHPHSLYHSSISSKPRVVQCG